MRMVNGEPVDSLETLALANRESTDRARSEERNKGKARQSPRSRSVDPYLGRRPPAALPFMTQSYPPATHPPIAEVPIPLVPKMSEYRSQFAWPQSGESTFRHADEAAEPSATANTPRKSISMGAIQASQDGHAQAPTRKHFYEDYVTTDTGFRAGRDEADDDMGIKSPTMDDGRTLEEQIIVTGDGQQMDDMQGSGLTRPKKTKTEYKSKYKSPSKFVYVDGGWKRSKEFSQLDSAVAHATPEDIALSWYGEVLELRKKAGEYKVRSWGISSAPEHLTHIYSHQKEVWSQVSQRSSLAALALAATPSPLVSRPPAGDFDAISRGRTRHTLDRTTPSGGRSASVGPEGRSPKHRSRTAPMNGVATDDTSKRADSKRPRPTSLATSGHRAKSAGGPKSKDFADDDALAKPHLTGRQKPSKIISGKEDGMKKLKEKEKHVVLVNGDDGHVEKHDEQIQSPEEPFKSEMLDDVPMIKSPPEPTRVKSPEQIIVKSPEPVKWTVPLETGIKWTGNPKIDATMVGNSAM